MRMVNTTRRHINAFFMSEKNNMTKEPREIHELTCPKCGKLITSLYESQADYNMKAHMITCKGAKK